MDENEKVLVNFINEDTGQEHELEIPLGITANALVLALSRAYGLHIEDYGSQECYMACEHPVYGQKPEGGTGKGFAGFYCI